MSRHAVVAALEAIEEGDIALAVEILLEAREGPSPERRYECPGCGERFAWPGLRDAHQLRECRVAA